VNGIGLLSICCGAVAAALAAALCFLSPVARAAPQKAIAPAIIFFGLGIAAFDLYSRYTENARLPRKKRGNWVFSFARGGTIRHLQAWLIGVGFVVMGSFLLATGGAGSRKAAKEAERANAAPPPEVAAAGNEPKGNPAAPADRKQPVEATSPPKAKQPINVPPPPPKKILTAMDLPAKHTRDNDFYFLNITNNSSSDLHDSTVSLQWTQELYRQKGMGDGRASQPFKWTSWKAGETKQLRLAKREGPKSVRLTGFTYRMEPAKTLYNIELSFPNPE